MSDMTGLKIVQLHWSALTLELRDMRNGIDRLAARFSKENGPNSETAQRAEAASVAIRRLERALLQREIQRISAGQGAVGVCDETE